MWSMVGCPWLCGQKCGTFSHAKFMINECHNCWPTAAISVFELVHSINVGVDRATLRQHKWLRSTDFIWQCRIFVNFSSDKATVKRQQIKTYLSCFRCGAFSASSVWCIQCLKCWVHSVPQVLEAFSASSVGCIQCLKCWVHSVPQVFGAFSASSVGKNSSVLIS